MFAAVARAKLNLALHVTGVRPDGYHLLSSVVAFAEVGDRVTVTPAASLSLEVGGAFAGQLTGSAEDNLVWRTAMRLREVRGGMEGAAIRLRKNLPVASGIGGGSSDAAAAALLLNRLWRLGLSRERLADLLLPLGADIPLCLYGTPAIAEGIGERIAPLDSPPPFWVVLVHPGVAVATSEVFALYDRASPPPDRPIREEKHWLTLLRRCHNALEEPACRLAPVIREARAALTEDETCLLARMSGSGATCFGLYANPEAARAAAVRISARYPDWWVRIGGSLA